MVAQVMQLLDQVVLVVVVEAELLILHLLVDLVLQEQLTLALEEAELAVVAV